ncbi:hypothetical protein, partial [Escherichia coli]|uniref:hypothetical protein n=1 Tax=Escherichia coli TaxID=562 RepID=UPI0019D6299F
VIEFNSSNRFFAGKDVILSIIKNGMEMINVESIITKVEIIETQILYNYQMEINVKEMEETNKILTIYFKLFEKV